LAAASEPTAIKWFCATLRTAVRHALRVSALVPFSLIHLHLACQTSRLAIRASLESFAISLDALSSDIPPLTTSLPCSPDGITPAHICCPPRSLTFAARTASASRSPRSGPAPPGGCGAPSLHHVPCLVQYIHLSQSFALSSGAPSSMQMSSAALDLSRAWHDAGCLHCPSACHVVSFTLQWGQRSPVVPGYSLFASALRVGSHPCIIWRPRLAFLGPHHAPLRCWPLVQSRILSHFAPFPFSVSGFHFSR